MKRLQVNLKTLLPLPATESSNRRRRTLLRRISFIKIWAIPSLRFLFAHPFRSIYSRALYCFSLAATFCQEEDVVLRLIPRRSRDFHTRRNWVARDAEQKDDFPFYPQSAATGVPRKTTHHHPVTRHCLPTGIYSSFVLAYSSISRVVIEPN